MGVWTRSRRGDAANRFRPGVEALEERAVPASDGSLDPTFGGSGKSVVVLFDNGGDNNDFVRGVAVQPDHKTLVVGAVQFDSEGDFDFGVLRLNEDGSLDTSFNQTGKKTIAFDLGGDDDDRAHAVAVQPDGKIVVVGYARSSAGDYDLAVARLTSSGALDTTFSGDGKTTVSFNRGGANDDRAVAVALQPDGKILLVGHSQYNTTDFDFAVARLTASGALDTTFSGDGKQVVSFDLGGGLADKATGVALQGDGAIVLGGYAETASGYDFAVARLDTLGALDTTFSGDGRQTVTFTRGGAANAKATGVVLDGSGRIVLGGHAAYGTSGDRDFAAARLTTSGALDTTFSGDGRQTVAFDLGGSKDDQANAIGLQSDGRIVLGGWTQRNDSGDYDFAAARLLPDGSLDNSFDNNGKKVVFFDRGSDNKDTCWAMAVPADDRIVLAGSVRHAAGDFDFGVVRFGLVPQGANPTDPGPPPPRPPVIEPHSGDLTGVLPLRYGRLLRRGQTLTQEVTVRVPDGRPVADPLLILLDRLGRQLKLLGASTRVEGKLKVPYVVVSVTPSGEVVVRLRFKVTGAPPKKLRLQARLLAGGAVSARGDNGELVPEFDPSDLGVGGPDDATLELKA